MNLNAARHLTLIVSILLCFFVYMGYRYWGSGEARPEGAGEASAVIPAVGDSGSAPSETASGSRPGDDTGSFSLTPPPADDAPVRPGDALQPIGSVEGRGTQTPPAGIPPPPPGSMEESETEAEAITGLVPESSLPPPPRSASLTPPGALPSSPAEPEPEDEAVPASLPMPPSSPSGDADDGDAPPEAGADTPPPSFPLRPSAAGGIRETRPVSPPRPETPFAATLPPRPPAAASPATPPADPVAALPSTPDGDMPIGDSLRIYIVQPGDTLSRIATRELGSIALADNIFLLNRDVISDPDHLMAGVRIRLPLREILPGAAGLGESERWTVHQVQRGETLSSIAARYYGSSSAWKFLHQANKSVLPNPNQLQPGMELMIPPYGEEM